LWFGIALSSFLGGFSDFGRDVAAIGIVTVLTLIYTFEGGMAAVIWTDVIQTSIYVIGTIIGFFTILHLVPGGWSTVSAMARDAGKFRVFDFSWDFYKTYTFWSGVLGGAFLTTASHGTDQLIVQRLLAAKTMRQSQLALLASGVAVFFQFGLFLMVGAMLFVFYQLFPPLIAFSKTDRIFPTFIVTRMPHGVSGLLIAAILAAAMSNLSAALNSLSSTTILDFYARLRPDVPESRLMLLSRAATVAWGIVLFVLATVSRSGGKVVELGLGIAVGRVRCVARSFLVGSLHKEGDRVRRHGRNALRIRGERLLLAVHESALYMVRGAGQHSNFRGGLCEQLGALPDRARGKIAHGHFALSTYALRLRGSRLSCALAPATSVGYFFWPIASHRPPVFFMSSASILSANAGIFPYLR